MTIKLKLSPRLYLLGGFVLSMWIFVIWIFLFTVKEARRQKRRRTKRTESDSKEGGIAVALARELQDKFVNSAQDLSISDFIPPSLYLTDAMLFDHERFRSQYERIPEDYPDAFTINRAKIQEENRFGDYMSETREVDCLIRNLVKRSVFRMYSHISVLSTQRGLWSDSNWCWICGLNVQHQLPPS